MKIFDLHNDCLTQLKNYKKYLIDNKNNFICSAIYKGNISFEKALQLADSIKEIKNTKVCFEDISYKGLDVDKIIELSPAYVSLTYNDENELGYGVNYNLPLKQKGINIAKHLAKNGVVIDTAHLCKKGVYSLLDNGCKIINSHTLLDAVYKHKRNISNDIVVEILKGNGLIGLTLVGYFLGGKSVSIFNYFKHVDYFLQRFGDGGVCIGSDFNGTDYLPKNLSKYSHFCYLKRLLKKHGYSSSTVDKIFYKNAEEFFKWKKGNLS